MITVGLYGISDTNSGTRPIYTHDHGVAIMKDRRVITVVQLERWTGRKHDNRLAAFIDEILERFIPPNEPVRFVSVNSFMGNAFISHSGNFRIEPENSIDIADVIKPARVIWYPDGKRKRQAEAWIITHEFAHIASILPFVGAFKDRALLAHIDGGAYQSNSSFWTIQGRRPRLLKASWDELHTPVHNFHNSPLSRTILGLSVEDHLSMPGKLMGYTAYGRIRPEVMSWLNENGWFLETKINKDMLLKELRDRFNIHHREIDLKEPIFQDICAGIQEFFRQQITDKLKEYKEKFNTNILYMAGGAALNIPTNTGLEGIFDDVYIPPCTNDSGVALGAAAWLEYITNGDLEIHSPFLNGFDAPDEPEPDYNEVKKTAALLAGHKVVGVCNGPAEVGPRALGHRSILARMDDRALRVRISEGIKQREWYRPLAVVMLQDVAGRIFGEQALKSHLAPLMLSAWRVPRQWEKAFRGVIHANGSVRVQVINENSPDFRWLGALLDVMNRDYGITGLINTSFNMRGQPILHRHKDAMPLAHKMGLDALVLQGKVYKIQ